MAMRGVLRCVVWIVGLRVGEGEEEVIDLALVV